MDLGVVVIDDRRTFTNRDAIYARNAREGMRVLAQAAKAKHSISELWLDHDLGDGVDVRPILQFLRESAESGSPLQVDNIYVHTANPVRGDVMVQDLMRYYSNVLRVSAPLNNLIDSMPEW